jgi:hypothetical protein
MNNLLLSNEELLKSHGIWVGLTPAFSLAWLNILICRWRRYVISKRRGVSELHGFTIRKTVFFTIKSRLLGPDFKVFETKFCFLLIMVMKEIMSGYLKEYCTLIFVVQNKIFGPEKSKLGNWNMLYKQISTS